MKAVLTSIQPYYVFVIIARIMGWDIPQEKKIEVRKDFPKASDWNRTVHIYCSKNRKSFKRIPEQYQPIMKKLLGKVIGEFICNGIIQPYCSLKLMAKESCLTIDELHDYSNGKDLYGWRISDLKIYDKPRELGEFYRPVKYDSDGPICGTERELNDISEWDCETVFNKEHSECTLKDCTRLQTLYRLKCPPQSWRYVEI